jgi:glycosyltransferase involved in cell wall biosynthesis
MYGVHESKVRIIPFPTPTLPVADTCPVSRPAAELPYVFYPARLWPHKNHVVVLAAIALLKASDIHIKCVFSGADEGNLEYLLRYASHLGIGDRMEYVGKVPDEALGLLYKGALCLVYASAVGPDNLPPLEAMSFDCPAITAEVPGAREQYGDAALYFDPISERELASRIRELIEDPGVRRRLIENGQARAAKWSPEDYAREVIALLDEFALRSRAWERCDSAFT